MIYDLRTILDGWEYEPGKISVRKIIGRDGREKIQTRVDLGLLQLETTGRPDGARPHGCDSLLDYFERRLREFERRNGDDDGFALTPEECRELRHETHLLYQRYLALFVLEEFDGVERDTTRALRAIRFAAQYGEASTDRQAMEAQRGYVMMMLTRARAYLALKSRDFTKALQRVRDGMDEFTHFDDDECDSPGPDHEAELRVLRDLEREILGQMPEDAPAKLERELAAALEREDYEQAARLRDRLALRPSSAARRD